MQSSARDNRTLIDELPPLPVELEGATGTSLHELLAADPLALLGRGTHCDVRLEDAEVSRRHALLVRWGNAVFCADLGSNGGTQFHPGGSGHGWLANGVAIAIGPYRIKSSLGVADELRRLMLHRDLLPFEREHDWQLQFVSGEVQPGAYTLRRPLTLIGRRSPCKIQLKLPDIKSVHAALLVTPDGLYLRDLSGRSAVRVDGQAWLRGWLRDGQIVELGSVRIRVSKVASAFTARLPEAETDDPVGSITQESIPPYSSEDALVPHAGVGSPPPLAQPILSGRYQIQKRIARGGMGVVYEGLDLRLHRVVAIKVVRGKGDATRLGRQRLLREAMVSARLDHPNVVRVLDADREGRYAVFEYVAGETLGETLRRTGRFSPVQAATWMAQVADAIEQLGRHGIVHRDIKPANVLVTPSGTAKLVDFGLAYIADVGDSTILATLTEETERPRRGIAIGTAPFASPEQFENARAADTRSDIYSAGCTLYSLLAGRPPFFGTLNETFRLHREVPPPPIHGLPSRLFTIIEKCLAKDPADRYPSGGVLAADLAHSRRNRRGGCIPNVRDVPLLDWPALDPLCNSALLRPGKQCRRASGADSARPKQWHVPRNAPPDYGTHASRAAITRHRSRFAVQIRSALRADCGSRPVRFFRDRTMFESELLSNALLLEVAEMLFGDISDADFVQQPLPATNHPAWILCHLAMAGDGAVGLLGGEKLLPADWATKYGRDSKVSSERSEYPPREEIVTQFRATYARARELAMQADPERIALPNPNSRLRAKLPTIRDMCGFLITGHLGMHLGQLSAWRRMRGLPPLF